MSATLKLEKLNSLCRCCHTQGTFKSLFTSCSWMGDKKTQYYGLLKELNIELATVSELVEQLLCTICDGCIRRLEDAVVFKHQVQECERTFHNIIFTNDAESIVKVKDEIIEDYKDNIKLSVAFQDCDNDDTEQINATHGSNKSNDHVKTEHTHDSDLDLGHVVFDDEESIPARTKKAINKKEAKSSKTKKKKQSLEDTEAKKEKINSLLKPHLQENTHYREVVTSTKTMYQCCICEKQWSHSLLNRLRKHIYYVHLKSPRYHCSDCNKDFLTLTKFNVHKYQEHNIDDRLKCNACDKSFNNRAQLNRHINVFHMLGKKQKCEHCDFETFSVENLYKHKFKHKTVKDFHCAYCKKSFVRKSTLDLHERIHTGDRRKVCSVCGQAFVQKASLNYHMTKHHPDINY